MSLVILTLMVSIKTKGNYRDGINYTTINHYNYHATHRVNHALVSSDLIVDIRALNHRYILASIS